MVEESVEQGCRHDRITEHFAPLGEAAVRSQDHRPALVARVDELEEQVAATGDDGEVADLVHDQQRGPAEIADALAQGAVALGLGQRGHEVGQRREHDAAPGLDRLDGERDRQMALAGAGWSEQMDDLGPVDEGQFRQRQDALAVERGLEGKVEPGQRLDRGQARDQQGGLHAAVLAQRQFLGQDHVEGGQTVDLALLDAPDRRVEHLQGARHAQADQAALDAVEGRGDTGGGAAHRWPPIPPASRSPTAW
ncbi:hypothetical protein LNAOJCKE_5701 [Methylorubrum aminovorans]|uniref:Uncharacterized protein n=1 Tax=Methylorubrum aminovorans TaxID=269069 RepID=A0ABQ4UNQ2_9HYPH|nr:hypothetical protein LNAOJCKE_5701 [Methylorubrum aminovorans]